MAEHYSLARQRPIFLLGSGRCGSTFFQTQLSKTGLIWIWGEHDGAIGRLLKWMDETNASKPLGQFSFKTDISAIGSVFDSCCHHDATQAAWVNGFRAGDVEDLTRAVICGLMTRNLPPGKMRWGFKEIRYGPEDASAERLLRLFPEGLILHTLRQPFSTIESNILAWNKADVAAAQSGVNASALQAHYDFYAARWLNVSRYLLNLEARMPHRVRSVHLETYLDEADGVATFLGCPPLPRSDAPVNTRMPSPLEHGTAIQQVFQECRARLQHSLEDVAMLAGYRI